MKMMTHGILNKIILILMISVLMYEDLLDSLTLLIFFEMTNIKYEKDTLMEYFSCGKKH